MQWKDDEWAIDWDNKLIYIDGSTDRTAAEILNELLGSVRADGKSHIDSTNFHHRSVGWGEYTSCEDMTHDEYLVWSQEAHLRAAGVRLAGEIAEAAALVIYGFYTVDEVGALIATFRLLTLWRFQRVFKLAHGVKEGIVIGKYPAYVQTAKKLKLKCFDVGKLWDSLTKEEQWKLNKAFLDAAAERGDSIVLASKLIEAKAGSYFRKEIDYLISKGYKVSDDGATMVKK